MKKLYTLLFLVYGFITNAQIVNIPDANFKAKLLSANASNQVTSMEIPIPDSIYNTWTVSSYHTIDINGDGEIQVSEAQAIKWLKVNVSGISSLTGIEAFTNLIYLDCNSNQLTALDITQNTQLKHLDCSSNQLTVLDVTQNTQLQFLSFTSNQLTTIGVSGLTNLQYLSFSNTLLTTIDVSGLTNLQTLVCSGNQLTSLNVSNLTNLQYLELFGNQLTSLNVSGLTNLQFLDCGLNQLTSLNVYDLTNLQTLFCSDNQLTSLNVSDLTNLQTLECNFNQLSSLNIKNSNSYWENLFFSNNPNLQYICADEEDVAMVQSKINAYGYATTCQVNSYCSFTPGGVFYTIQSNNRFDGNANGCDVTDFAYPNLKFNLTNGTQSGSLIANAAGSYTLPVSAGVHTITPQIENPSYFNVSPTSATVDFPAQASPFTQDFCIVPNGNHSDLEITLIPIDAPVPGFNVKYKLVYKNKGNQVANGQISLTFGDTVLDFVSSIPTFTNATTGSLSLDYTNLLPFESRSVEFIMNLNTPMDTPPLNGGDFLNYTATINPIAIDETPTDNVFILNQTVVNSYDPNDKICLEGETINPSMIGDYVHYQIRFENTGTFPAQNVVVKDMIDTTKFDIATLQMVNTSHSCYTRITGNKVEFIFENINLPFDDATNDGYVVFKIKTKPTLTVNSTISNTAEIYFDYNFPIVTNTATSTYQVLANQDFDFASEFSLYPNPVKNLLSINAKKGLEVQSLEIYNTFGQLVIAKPNFEQIIDVSVLPSGTYFIKASTEKGRESMKFVKQ